MSKYRSREEPPDGVSITERHNTGYCADRVKLERNIRQRWMKDYGYRFYGEQPLSYDAVGEPCEKYVHGHGAAEKGLLKGHGCISGPRWPPRGPIPKVKSDLKEVDERSILTAPIGWYNYDEHVKGNGSGWRQDEVGAPKMTYDYSTPGNVQKHHVVKDHVTSYSSSFGHHSVQFRDQKPMRHVDAKPLNYFYLNDSTLDTKRLADLDKSSSSSSGLDLGIPHKPDGRVDLDKLSQSIEGCSWAELQKRLEEVPLPGVCPKCSNHIVCTCVPRRRERVPEDLEDGPNEELPPWPRQIWYGPSYAGSRRGTTGDILRLRYHLSRDPEWKTPMNRMYDEMKALNYSGGKSQHYGDNSFSCGLCRTTREAERGTWFDEQLRKGNPFTTGDTQFKSGAYVRRK